MLNTEMIFVGNWENKFVFKVLCFILVVGEDKEGREVGKG